MISVEVKPFFDIKEIIRKPHLEMEVEEGTTVEGLLMQLVETYGPELRKVLIDPETGEIESHYMILINGKGTFQFPEGINMSLEDGDVISILMFLTGG